MKYLEREVTVIDWNKIAHAILMYRGMGFIQRDVPWITYGAACSMTVPPETPLVLTALNRQGHPIRREIEGFLIGSGEQGLLSIRGTLVKGQKYVTCTPCFRYEDEYNERNLPYFMKVELMHVLAESDPDVDWCLMRMMNKAVIVMQTWFRDIKHVETKDGFDLIANGIEIGSYGFRENQGFRWIYGTGLAEPRFSQATEQR